MYITAHPQSWQNPFVQLYKRCQRRSYQMKCQYMRFPTAKLLCDMISFRIYIVPLCKCPTFIVTCRLFATVDKPITSMTLLHITRKTVSLCIVQHVPSQDGILILKCCKRLMRVKGKSHPTHLQLFLIMGQTQIHTFLNIPCIYKPDNPHEEALNAGHAYVIEEHKY